MAAIFSFPTCYDWIIPEHCCFSFRITKFSESRFTLQSDFVTMCVCTVRITVFVCLYILHLCVYVCVFCRCVSVCVWAVYLSVLYGVCANVYILCVCFVSVFASVLCVCEICLWWRETWEPNLERWSPWRQGQEGGATWTFWHFVARSDLWPFTSG